MGPGDIGIIAVIASLGAVQNGAAGIVAVKDALYNVDGLEIAAISVAAYEGELAVCYASVIGVGGEEQPGIVLQLSAAFTHAQAKLLEVELTVRWLAA